MTRSDIPSRQRCISRGIVLVIALLSILAVPPAVAIDLEWSELPPLPSPEGVAGPFVGVHDDALIVAGGANFPDKPLWESEKVWHADTYVLVRKNNTYRWHVAAPLPRPAAYGASVSLPEGVLCMGGNDAAKTYAETFILRWNSASNTTVHEPYPPLPAPIAYGSAVVADGTVYFTGGQHGASLDTASNAFWSLDMSERDKPTFGWKELPPIPGPPRAFHVSATVQARGRSHIFVVAGRTQRDGRIEFLRDVWRYSPATNRWTACAPAPRPTMAAPAIGWSSRILLLGGDDGRLFHQTDALRDAHPGFPREAFVYDVAADSWEFAVPIPANQVTTVAVRWNGGIVIASGEVRPRVRSPKVWLVTPTTP